MPDLHGWITQQITHTEAVAHAAEGKLDEMLGWCEASIPEAEQHITLHDPDAVLRRCAADRKILARHALDPDVHYEPACKGCRTYGDQEMAYTDNLIDCPELLDLADAYGLTPEILAKLDRPGPPPRPERPDIPPPVHLNAIMRLLNARPTSSVPAAQRGPNWPGPA